MSNQVYPINSYRFSQSDKLLLDANIWLYLYGPEFNAKDNRTISYSIALRKASAAKSQLFIDPHQQKMQTILASSICSKTKFCS